jgi:hypothetical protein
LDLNPRNPLLTAVQLAKGDFAIMDMHRIVFVDEHGTFLRAAGRRGRGPGEFLQTRRICRLAGDTLMVIDFIDGRISLRSGDGTHVRSFPRIQSMAQSECSDDGLLVARVDQRQSAARNSSDSLVPYALVRPDGRVVRSIGDHPAVVRGAFAPVPWFLPFGNKVVVADGRRFELRTFDLDGQLTQVTRLVSPPPDVTDLQWDEEVENAVPVGAPPSVAASIKAQRRRMRPNRYPALQQLRRDTEGRVWVSDYASDQNWTIVTPDGSIAGRFTVPGAGVSRSGLAGFGNGYIILRIFDVDGSPSLAFHRYVFTPAM